MKETYRQDIHVPFSLHDMNVTAIEVTGNDMIIRTSTGLIHTSQPCRQIEGYVEINEVQWDFSYAYLLDFSGNEGTFTGEKMFLKDFIERFRPLGFTVMDETYGFNMTKFSGYLIDDDRFLECMIEICHEGFMIFVDESKYEGMTEVIFSHDSELMLYSVPAGVAAYLDEYCTNFANSWVWHGPENEKFLRSFGDGQLGAVFRTQDFIDYLNKWEFPNQPSTLIKCLGCHEIPEEYRNCPHFNF